MDVVKAIAKAAKEKLSFDLIICDPPTTFTADKKRQKVLDFYRDNLAQMANLLTQKGELVIFLNTHTTTFHKFKKTVQAHILAKKLNFKIDSHLTLNEDCPSYRAFPEGNYLKGLVIKRDSN